MALFTNHCDTGSARFDTYAQRPCIIDVYIFLIDGECRVESGTELRR